MSDFKRTIWGALLGLLATLLSHLFSFLLLGVGLAALGALAILLIRLFSSPELGEALGLIAIFSLPVGGLLAGAVDQLLPFAGAGAIFLGLVCGGLVGYLGAKPALRKWLTSLGAGAGLLFNLLILIIVTLLTSWATLLTLPAYLCVGPVTGMMAAFLIRRILPAPNP